MSKIFVAAIGVAALTLAGCSNISAYRPAAEDPYLFEPGEGGSAESFGGITGGGKSGGGGSVGPGPAPSTD